VGLAGLQRGLHEAKIHRAAGVDRALLVDFLDASQPGGPDRSKRVLRAADLSPNAGVQRFVRYSSHVDAVDRFALGLARAAATHDGCRVPRLAERGGVVPSSLVRRERPREQQADVHGSVAPPRRS
jgi:hypothetical protein